MCSKGTLRGLAIGIVITFPSIILAILSGGAGHGDYAFARLLFPYTMLLTLAQGDTISLPLRVLALIQFPSYGAIAGFSVSISKNKWLIPLILTVIHLVFVIACFSGVLPNFS